MREEDHRLLLRAAEALEQEGWRSRGDTRRASRLLLLAAELRDVAELPGNLPGKCAPQQGDLPVNLPGKSERARDVAPEGYEGLPNGEHGHSLNSKDMDRATQKEFTGKKDFATRGRAIQVAKAALPDATPLTRAMSAAGINITELARLAGVSKGAISQYGHGRAAPTEEVAERVRVATVSEDFPEGFTDWPKAPRKKKSTA